MIGAIKAKKAIAKSFEAMNRHDLARFVSGWRDDGVFIYPGEISVSGTFEGKSAVESWFRNFFKQFQKNQFDIQYICVRKIFAPTGNECGCCCTLESSANKRDGRAGQNSGVTVISIKAGKVFLVKDFIFDLGEDFKLNWGGA